MRSDPVEPRDRPAAALAFFLGGRDLEMATIRALLDRLMRAGDARVAAVHDPGLAWGAAASDHAAEIGVAAAAGLVPVLVELAPDIALPPGTLQIDHHGERTAEPCALRQVFDLLTLPAADWTRQLALVAANDTGHVPGLRAMGATEAEVAASRAADRAAQGITAAEEAAGLAALAAARLALRGTLRIVRLPHGRAATVADPLALRDDTRDLLLLTPGTREFYGSGARIARLDAAFPGGWRGGALPQRGFWGTLAPVAERRLLDALR